MFFCLSLKKSAFLIIAFCGFINAAERPAWRIPNKEGKTFNLFLDLNPRLGHGFDTKTWRQWATELQATGQWGTIQVIQRQDGSGFVDYFCDTPSLLEHPFLLATHILDFRVSVEHPKIIQSTYASTPPPLTSYTTPFPSTHNTPLSPGYSPSLFPPTMMPPFWGVPYYTGPLPPRAELNGPSYSFPHSYPASSFPPSPLALSTPAGSPQPSVNILKENRSAAARQPGESLTFTDLLALITQASEQDKQRLKALLDSSPPEATPVLPHISVPTPASTEINSISSSPSLTPSPLPGEKPVSPPTPSSPDDTPSTTHTPSLPQPVPVSRPTSAWSKPLVIQRTSVKSLPSQSFQPFSFEGATSATTVPAEIPEPKTSPGPATPLSLPRAENYLPSPAKKETLQQAPPQTPPHKEVDEKAVPEKEERKPQTRKEKEAAQKAQEAIHRKEERQRRAEQAQKDREAAAARKAQAAAQQEEQEKQRRIEQARKDREAATAQKALAQTKAPQQQARKKNPGVTNDQEDKDFLFLNTAIAQKRAALRQEATSSLSFPTPSPLFLESYDNHTTTLATLLQKPRSYLPARCLIEEFLRRKTPEQITFILDHVSKTSALALYYEALCEMHNQHALQNPLTEQTFVSLAVFVATALTTQLQHLEASQKEDLATSHTFRYLQRMKNVAEENRNPSRRPSLSLPSLPTFQCLVYDPANVSFETICTEFQQDMKKTLLQLPGGEKSISFMEQLLFKLFVKARSPEELWMAVKKTSVLENNSFLNVEALLIYLQHYPFTLPPDQLLPLLTQTLHQIEGQIHALEEGRKITPRPELKSLLDHLQQFHPVLTAKIQDIQHLLTPAPSVAAAALPDNSPFSPSLDVAALTTDLVYKISHQAVCHTLAHGNKEEELKIVKNILSLIKLPAHVPPFLAVFKIHGTTLYDDLRTVLEDPALPLDPLIKTALITGFNFN
jgi:hypothetical protein